LGRRAKDALCTPLSVPNWVEFPLPKRVKRLGNAGSRGETRPTEVCRNDGSVYFQRKGGWSSILLWEQKRKERRDGKWDFRGGKRGVSNKRLDITQIQKSSFRSRLRKVEEGRRELWGGALIKNEKLPTSRGQIFQRSDGTNWIMNVDRENRGLKEEERKKRSLSWLEWGTF